MVVLIGHIAGGYTRKHLFSIAQTQRKEKREHMNETEMREEIARWLAEADRATLSEVRVFLQYYLGVQGQNGGNV